MGFHEAKLSIEGIRAGYPYVERMAMEVKKLVKGSQISSPSIGLRSKAIVEEV
ncbi:MAG: hypothetical protein RMJ00_02975 [Nitrososphaerota archaeon]|nr:hypothetical protein [Candidatus Bathyarchaeota archaeon]MDW8061641.1 hypothetical protein [Nitrososphaerota archaeon]